MADVILRHNTSSPTLRDKILLFEGRSSPQPLTPTTSTTSISRNASSDFRSNSPYRGNVHLSPSRAFPPIGRDKNSVGESSRRYTPEIPTLSIPTSSRNTTTTTTPTSPRRTPEHPTISPRKWNVITLDPDIKPFTSFPSSTFSTSSPSSTSSTSTTSSTSSRDKGKERVTVFSLDYDRESAGDEDGSPKMQLPVLAKSPRRPSNAPKYEEEEVIKLKRMTAEEKQMVKTLIKLTTRKNKTMDALETDIKRERQHMAARVEDEKAGLSATLQLLDLELATKSRELSAETTRCSDLAEMVQKLERERQDIRMALAAAKRDTRQCKINCDAELNKKTQTLMDMTMQLTALTCLRQSMNCIICEEKVATAVLQPCRHMVMCGPCSHKVTKCPMCRVDIRNKFEIYNNWVI